MPKTRSCCGGPIRKRPAEPKEPLPSNPQVRGGVDIIYLGAGKVTVTGAGTKLVYYASDHRRQFKVAADDVAALVRRTDFILKP